MKVNGVKSRKPLPGMKGTTPLNSISRVPCENVIRTITFLKGAENPIFHMKYLNSKCWKVIILSSTM